MFLLLELLGSLRELEQRLVIETYDLLVLLGQGASLLAAVQDSDYAEHQLS